MQVEDTILKKDGQKADDAPVPTQIWENYFRDTLPMVWPNSRDCSLPGDRVYPLHPLWRSRLDSYRVLGICFWRQRVYRSFWGWVKQKLPRRVLEVIRHPHTYIRWKDGRYHWTKNGRTRYQEAHETLTGHPTCKKDWEPAWECVMKATDSD